MRYVVTGASGHVGMNVVRTLLARGHRVRAVCHDAAPWLAALDVERVDGDVRDPGSLRRAFAGQDIVVHLAAVISIDDRDLPLMRAVNVQGVENAGRAALAAGARRMIHVSSIHAFRMHRRGKPIDESTERCEHPPEAAYDRTKAAGERALRGVMAEGLDAVILNPVGLIGPDDHRPSHMGRLLQLLYRGRLPAVPRGGFVWADVRDVADAVPAAVERGRPGHNYILGGEPMSIKGFAGLLGELGGSTRTVLELPVWTISPVIPVSWLASKLIGSRRAYTRDSFRTLTSGAVIDSTKARTELGYAPRPIRESLADLVDWYRAQGMLPG